MILNSPFVPFLDDDDLDVATGNRLAHEYRPPVYECTRTSTLSQLVFMLAYEIYLA